MTNISLKTTTGKVNDVYRSYTPNADLSSTERLPPTKIEFGILQTGSSIGSTSLNYPIPIADGTVNDDGSNTLTGSSGGDNSTDNTITFKPGANVTDDTSQNLIANSSSASKIWAISNLATSGVVVDKTKRLGVWLYILDSTALNKFASSGTCLEFKIGSDASNYYSITYEASDLSTGWNWLGTNKENLEDQTETGTVGTPIDYFEIEITTNNATDTFTAGDVVYDLLRTFDIDDVRVVFDSGYPTINTTTATATIQKTLGLAAANGFDINSCAFWNEDSAPKVHSIHQFTAKSKTDTEEIVITLTDRNI